MADAVDFSKTQRIVLLVDLNQLLQSENPNPNHITSIIATSKIVLSLPRLSSSRFSFKLFFSSLSPLKSGSTLDRLLPNHDAVSLSFGSPPQTLDSLRGTLDSILYTKLTYSPSNAYHTAEYLLELAENDVWESNNGHNSGKTYHDHINIFLNLVILLSPYVDDCSMNANGFGDVNEAFKGKDVHFCWVDIHRHEKEAESNESALIAQRIRKFGWAYCSLDSIVLGSALVSFGLIYPNIGVSSKFLDSDKRIRGQLSLKTLDVDGEPLECKGFDLELLHLKASSEAVNSMNTMLGSLKDGIIKFLVTDVQRYTMFEEFSSDHFLVQIAESGEEEKDGTLDGYWGHRCKSQI